MTTQEHPEPSLQTSTSIYESEEEKRAQIKAEGKKWAEFVGPDNAWDTLVLTLGGC